MPPVTVNFMRRRQRLGDEGEGFAERADGLCGRGGAGIDGEVEAEVGLAGDADLAADEPVDHGVEVDGAGLDVFGGGEQDGKGDLVFVAEVHERAERKTAGDGELHGAGGDAVGERPGDFGWLAGVAGVDPVDVPVLLEREDEADLEGSAGGDGGASETSSAVRCWALTGPGPPSPTTWICAFAAVRLKERRRGGAAGWRCGGECS